MTDTTKPPCPLDGTVHEKLNCPLKGIMQRMPLTRCPLVPDCEELIAEENRAVLARLHEAARWVGYYNAVEGDWSRETEARTLAYEELRLATHEAAIRGLEYDLSGYLL